MKKLRTIAFDADDTLWHNERFFHFTQQRFAELLGDFAEPDHLDARLLAAEKRNIGHYGFGVKGFTLSMIETAIEVTDGRVPATVIAQLLEAGRDMLDHPLELLPHAQEAVEGVVDDHHLLLITKGDLLHQERKLAQSGLGDLFDGVEIVSDKQPQTYQRIFGDLPGGTQASMMVGNSMKSDVRPAIDVGSWGVFVPHDLAWDLEHAEAPESERYHAIADLSELSDLVAKIG
ncbi:haloacid dehalogenase-like hydrolase [Pelagimonas phthalicica]|uniref:Haloacid dehalogenase-like hydrolase n=1 Tax=Pelagimonas phthalicica TaxID=1037362 RepID=A0A238JJ15_9RHOB|nr:HAD family hydrolase [Pelagimonas phthalicica]TDS89764.1 putative hydrolase of the HAD superfamily [Pelagimonas phthalicica]SMX29932.1 haloacid dehalogenase-like hydrolase [Pelagimonas phthalicica]